MCQTWVLNCGTHVEYSACVSLCIAARWRWRVDARQTRSGQLLEATWHTGARRSGQAGRVLETRASARRARLVLEARRAGGRSPRAGVLEEVCRASGQRRRLGGDVGRDARCGRSCTRSGEEAFLCWTSAAAASSEGDFSSSTRVQPHRLVEQNVGLAMLPARVARRVSTQYLPTLFTVQRPCFTNTER